MPSSDLTSSTQIQVTSLSSQKSAPESELLPPSSLNGLIHDISQLSSPELSDNCSDRDQDANTTSTLNPANLPSEIMVNIFSWLDLRSLDAAGLVCKHWYRITTDESVWRAAFKNTFEDHENFSRLTSSVSWKTEFIERTGALKRWKKASGSRNISFKVLLPDLTRIAVDFIGMRIISFSLMTERGVAVDLSNARVSFPYIRTSKLGTDNEDISGIPDVSKYGMVFPFSNGRVTTVAFSRGLLNREFKRFPVSHEMAAVTSAWTSKTVSPKTPNAITCVTGDSKGGVKACNFLTGEELFAFNVPSWDDEPIEINRNSGYMPFEDLAAIVHIDSDSEKAVVVCDNGGRIFHYRKDTKDLTFIGTTPVIADAEMHLRNGYFTVDFPGGYILSHENDHIVRYRIDKNTASPEANVVKLVTGNSTFEKLTLGPFNLDESLYTGVATSTTPKLLPGHGSRFLASFTSDNRIHVWDMRQSAGSNDDSTPEIHPLYSIENPFSKQAEVTGVAINSLVLAICSSSANVMVHNALTGKRIRLATSRFPKNILDFSSMGDHPAYQVVLDPDATKCHGVVVINNAVQYFSYGITATSQMTKSKGVKKRMVGHRTGTAPGSLRNEDLLKDMEDEYQIAKEIVKRQQNEERRRNSASRASQSSDPETAFLDEMTEEEQLRYALMISQDTSSWSKETTGPDDVITDDEDNDLKAAIELSLKGAENSNSSGSRNEEYDDHEEDDMYDNESGSSYHQSFSESGPSNANEGFSDDVVDESDIDKDLALALRLSLKEQ